MDANAFISKLRADGSDKDFCNMSKIFQDYSIISTKLPSKDRALFSLNVLCVLCRNLDKVPTWRSNINQTELVNLAIQCLRETRTLEKADRVKLLASAYHIHKYAVREAQDVPPQLVLKLSYMPFENDHEKLLHEYAKTYWNICFDRITYIEKLRTKISIRNLLKKLSEDIHEVVKMYDSVQFCSTIINFLIKKLHLLYSDSNPAELNSIFERIFEILSSKDDVKSFKKLSQKDTLDVYTKLIDCLYVITENGTKVKFRDISLTNTVMSIIGLIGHTPDIYQCSQIFIQISVIFDKQNHHSEDILNNLISNFEIAEKSGYCHTMLAIYPYISQFIKLYTDYYITNHEALDWNHNFNEDIQESCLKIIYFLMGKLKNCSQISKCINCNINTGLHDALRLSFVSKQLIILSIEKKIPTTKTLPIYLEIIKYQHAILKHLCGKNCGNYERGYKKLQSDIHNTAIAFNNNKQYEFSIKLLDIYLEKEMANFKTEIELKNISRALYNKSICELDNKQHKLALRDAFLSLIFALPEGLSTEKYMSLIIDIKAKAHPLKNDSFDSDVLQLMTVVDICQRTVESNEYGNLKPFFNDLKFSKLLKHEFSMYIKLWPSLIPIAGVWRSLHQLTKGTLPWLKTPDSSIRQTLYEIIAETPTAVRTVHSDYFVDIVKELVAELEKHPALTQDMKVIQATLFFLKAEHDLAHAAVQHEWKFKDPNMDPDQVEATRTIEQEYDAVKYAMFAVDLWTDIIQDLDSVENTSTLQHALQTAQIFVVQLLHLHRTLHGLQLAHVCCTVARHLGDKETYIRNAGVILYNTATSCDKKRNADTCCATCRDLQQHAQKYLPEMMTRVELMDMVICYMSDLAIHRARRNMNSAAEIVQIAQAHLLHTLKNHPDVNLGLATGHLMEAQGLLSKAYSGLSDIVNAQRHYLTVSNTATNWTCRRLLSLSVKLRLSACGLVATRTARAVLLRRRARSCAGAALQASSAHAHAALFACVTDPNKQEDAKKKIDHRLKYILGVTPTSRQPCVTTDPKTEPIFTPKQELELMLENRIKKPTSPTKFPVLGFRTPEFLLHDNCSCYQCENPFCYTLICVAMELEASMYFRAKEDDIARSYHAGCLDSLRLVEMKLKKINDNFNKKFDSHVIDNYIKLIDNEYQMVVLDILVENSFFELSLNNFQKVDENIVRIHEIIHEIGQIDCYLENEVQNLLITRKRLKDLTKQLKDIDALQELENLHLSTNEEIVQQPKTPEIKAEKPPKIIKTIVNDEELPKRRRRIIEFHLDEENAEEKPNTSKTVTKKSQFKTPAPKTTKPILESVTPRNTRSKPNVLEKTNDSSIFDFATLKIKEGDEEEPLEIKSHFKIPAPISSKSIDSTSRNNRSKPILSVTEDFGTPKATEINQNSDFVTPNCTPNSDQFFTPMTSIKTYTKKPLRHEKKNTYENIVKNLEAEFLKPIEDKASETKSQKPIETKTKNLKPVDLETQTSNQSVGTNKVATKELKTIREKTKIIQKTKSLDHQDRHNIEKCTSKVKTDTKSLIPKAKTSNPETTDKENSKLLNYLVVPKTTRSSRSKVETGSLKDKRRLLKRATSPGKLEK